MNQLVGFELDAWDYITLGSFAVIGLGGLGLAALVLGMPGRIAVKRRHPDAEAVGLMGWLGFLAIVPWVQALIWSLKPADKVDIREFPEGVRRETDQQIARLSGRPADGDPPAPARAAPP